MKGGSRYGMKLSYRKEIEKGGRNNMVKILIVTHEDLGKALLDSAELIVGKQTDIEAFSLKRGEDILIFSKAVEQRMKAYASTADVLIFTDLFGGSPTNAVMSHIMDYPFRCLTGVNLPMLLEALITRQQENITLDEIAMKCKQAALDGVKDVNSIIAEDYQI